MSLPSEFSRPLYHAMALMQAQMNEPSNLAKPHWDQVLVADLQRDLTRNLNKLELARKEGDAAAAWRRAANAANFAWMIAAKVEHDSRG